jgi:hypothetical protein
MTDEGLGLPGLYAWFADDAGAEDLTRGLGHVIAPGRIYVGQTGATKWPSGKRSQTVLRDRLGSNHILGNIRGSTFRRTLAACLANPPEVIGRMTAIDETDLTRWIKQHLSFAIAPIEDRDIIGAVEVEVMRVLSPLLNIRGLNLSPLRSGLRDRRRMLKRTGAHSSRRLILTKGRVPDTVEHRVYDQPTLHEEIRRILAENNNRWMTTSEIADLVNRRAHYIRRDKGPVTALQIHGRTRNDESLFDRDGARVRLLT